MRIRTDPESLPALRPATNQPARDNAFASALAELRGPDAPADTIVDARFPNQLPVSGVVWTGTGTNPQTGLGGRWQAGVPFPSSSTRAPGDGGDVMGGPEIDRSGYRRCVPGATADNPAPFGYYNDCDGELPFLRGLARTAPSPLRTDAAIDGPDVDAEQGNDEAGPLVLAHTGSDLPIAPVPVDVPASQMERTGASGVGGPAAEPADEPAAAVRSRPRPDLYAELAALLTDLLRLT